MHVGSADAEGRYTERALTVYVAASMAECRRSLGCRRQWRPRSSRHVLLVVNYINTHPGLQRSALPRPSSTAVCERQWRWLGHGQRCVIDVIKTESTPVRLRAGEGETSDSAGPVDQGLANAAPITVPRHNTTDQSVPWVIEDFAVESPQATRADRGCVASRRHGGGVDRAPSVGPASRAGPRSGATARPRSRARNRWDPGTDQGTNGTGVVSALGG